jgi:ABC-type multidrug transport system ATPase subunit
MLLVLGKPGSGCTTFLKTLSGLWDEYKEIEGELTLGGHLLQDVMAQRPQDILFCGQSSLVAVFSFEKHTNASISRV